MIHRIVRKLRKSPFDRLEYAYGGMSLYIKGKEIPIDDIQVKNTRSTLEHLQSDFAASGIQEIVINLK